MRQQLQFIDTSDILVGKEFYLFIFYLLNHGKGGDRFLQILERGENIRGKIRGVQIDLFNMRQQLQFIDTSDILVGKYTRCSNLLLSNQTLLEETVYSTVYYHLNQQSSCIKTMQSSLRWRYPLVELFLLIWEFRAKIDFWLNLRCSDWHETAAVESENVLPIQISLQECTESTIHNLYRVYYLFIVFLCIFISLIIFLNQNEYLKNLQNFNTPLFYQECTELV